MVMAAVVLAPVLSPMSQSDADLRVPVLYDPGNGDIEWIIADGDDIDSILNSALSGLGMEYVGSGGVVVIDGLECIEVGRTSDGGSFTSSGTTGVTVRSEWHVFGWTGSVWTEVHDLSVANTYSALSVAFYPDGVVPVANPECMYPMVMFRGDALNRSDQTATVPAGTYEYGWNIYGAALSSPLYADGKVYYKFGEHYMPETNPMASGLVCIDPATGGILWRYDMPSEPYYDSASPLIVGDVIYVPTVSNEIYAFELIQDPDDVQPFAVFRGSDHPGFDDGTGLVGENYNTGFCSMVYSYGVIYVANSNGMVYCLDMDLNLVWSYRMGGSAYLTSPTVYDGKVYIGAMDGHLYIIDAFDGSLILDENVYQKVYNGVTYGYVAQVHLQQESDGDIILYIPVSDGRGMFQENSGLAVYRYSSDGDMTRVILLDDGLESYNRFAQFVDTDVFTGVYFITDDGMATNLKRISSDGTVEVMGTGLLDISASMVLVNDRYIYAVTSDPEGVVYVFGLDGEVIGTYACPESAYDYNMMPPLVIDGMVICGTDSGLYACDGGWMATGGSGDNGGMSTTTVLAIVLIIVVAMVLAYWGYMRHKGVDHPFRSITDFTSGRNTNGKSRTASRKARLKYVLAIGSALVFVSFTLSICIGATSMVNPIDAYSALFSAISKGGEGLSILETTIYTSRMPRALAALAIGVGLSVAGCVYQAIIRNPMVDPYIMGVSSGAGVAAVAVIAFDFTLFGLFAPHSIYLTAIVSMIGGLIAFFCTMFLAEKSGGSSINYVLAGIVIGLAAGAVQSLMLTMAGSKLNSAIAWLYGSFAEVTLTQVGIIFFLCLFLSLVPLVWAKELNLVLLGEDQAQQMGLDVRRFNRMMLVLASVLTSVCVAFVGIIGFVGLVIPHLCRMLFGSDHRMVLPASICFGAVMLMLADLLARTAYHGMELPVGAITTIIGIPVFAYLLIKRGRTYDG